MCIFSTGSACSPLPLQMKSACARVHSTTLRADQVRREVAWTCFFTSRASLRFVLDSLGFWHLPADIPSIFTQAGVAQVLLTCGKDSDTTGLVVPVHHTWFTLDCSTTQDTHNMIVCSTCFFFFFLFARSWTFFFTGSYLEEHQKRKVFAFT